MSDYPYDYSEKELKLFSILGMLDMLKRPNIVPHLAYRHAAYLCFMEDAFLSESLKMAVRAANRRMDMIPQTIYRGTPEWDELIDFKH